MATKKKLLQAAAGSAGGGAAALNVEDVFATYLYEGNGSAQVIDNGINLGQSYGSGGVKFDGVDDYMSVPASTDFEFGTGDFTVEAWVNTDYSDYFNIWQNSPVTGGAGTDRYFIGVGTNGSVEFSFHAGGSGFSTSSGAVSQGTWAHVAVVRNSGTTYIYVDGVQQTSSSILSGYDFNLSSVHTIGYRVTPNYASGYMADLRVVKGTAVYTSNFTAPTSPLTAITNTVLLTCQGDGPFVDNSSSSHTVTVDGAKASTFGPFDAAEAGEGGLVWIKNRGSSGIYSGANIVFDTERGVGKRLYTNGTDAEFQQNSTNGQKSFNANGFTLGSDDSSGNYGINWTGYDYASWTFRKAPKFFTCLTYTGTGPASGANEQQVSHDLGVKPAVVIIKRTDSTGDWWFFTDVIDGSNDYGYLNQTAAFGNSSNNVPTDSVFNVGGTLNVSGATYVAYLFAHNNGDGDFGPTGDQDIIKCGSHTNSAEVDELVDLGWEPQWILTKKTNVADDWKIFDTMRGLTYDLAGRVLKPNSSNAEADNTASYVRNTGFTLRALAGHTSIYIAIRRGPMAVPTDATDVYKTIAYSGTNVARHLDTGFVTDLEIIQSRNSAETWEPSWKTRLTSTGNLTLNSSSTSGEYNWGTNGNTDLNTYQHGTSRASSYWNSSGYNYVSHQFSRAPNCFDVVAYTGDGAAQAVSHNLGVVPEFILLKNRSNVVQWTGYHKDLNGGTNPAHYKIVLNSTNGEGGSSHWNYTSPTSSDFTVGSSMSASSNNYIAYLFASLDGVSKVGSYTGNGTSQNIDCGFSSGARFVLIKRTDSTSPWWLWDSERGIVAGNDPWFDLNSNAGETTGYDWLDPYSSGFSIPSSGNNNASGASYIFYAVSA